MNRIAFVLVAALLGCAHEEAPHAVIVHPTPVTIEARSASGRSGPDLAPGEWRDASRIEVLPTKRPNRPAEIIGVVDAHLPMGDHDRALALLKQKAAELGADAVIAVDFAHGEGHHGEPPHLSGLAIRYIERPPRLSD
jgi:hypothetical protein